jgi:hypothetical protein
MRVVFVLVAVALAGCWQQTIYAGPRLDGNGIVAWEVGASYGGSAPIATGALTASVDSSGLYAAREERAVARKMSSTPEPGAPRGMVRGILEWGEWYPGFAWRAGMYGGAAFDDHQRAVGVIGCQATLSPLVWWGRNDAASSQHAALGLQIGTEAIPVQDVFVVRAALAIELQFLPKRW